MRIIAVSAVASLAAVSAMAQEKSKDLLDANGQYTNRALAIATVAAAEVVEMRCLRKGWITAAVRKFDGLGVHIDVNEKQDYADILYFSTNILEKADKVGTWQWCKTIVPSLATILEITQR